MSETIFTLPPWIIFMLFRRLLIFSKSTFSYILSWMPLECQTVWIQIRPDINSGLIWVHGECSGSVVECLTRGREARVRASPASLRCGPWARHIYPSLVLVQPRKTHPCLTERLLMGHKESHQTKQNKWSGSRLLCRVCYKCFVCRDRGTPSQ